MNYEALRFWLEVIQLATTLFIGLFAWYRTRQKVIEGAFKHVTAEIASHTTDITNLKGEIKTMKETHPSCPNHGQMDVRLNGHSDRLGQHKELLTAIETDLKHLPRSSDLGKLHEKINGVNGHLADLKAEVNKIGGAMPGITHLTEMMNEFLLNHRSH